MKPEAVSFIFEHAFLPPKLPQSDHEEAASDIVLQEFSRAVREFSLSQTPRSNEARVWARLARSLPKWANIYESGIPCSSTIINTLQTMDSDDTLLFYVKPQNAAIVVRNRSTGTIFECFEVLPKTDAVLAAKDALIRQFPARAVFVPVETMQNASFVQELGTAIHKLSVEELRLAMETTTKAKNTVVENRQSAHPRAVSEWLFGVLSSYGQATSSPTISKRVHDDVCWTNSSKPPWRRSGIWLSARVALQIALHNSDLAGEERSHYKNFMLFFLSRLATTISAVNMSPDTLHVLRVKLARRNAKLGSGTFAFVQESVRATLSRLGQSMQLQWKEVTERDNLTLPKVPVRDLSAQLAMKNSQSAVRHVWARSQQSFTYPQTTFAPHVSVRIMLDDTQLPDPSMFDKSGDKLVALVAFEQWVRCHLSNWMRRSHPQSSSCQLLSSLMRNYRKCAAAKYKGHPQSVSLMLLTLFDIWVALDKTATAVCPLLRQYPPDIDPIIFAPLLLCKRSELERLHQIECHLSARLSACNVGYPSLFSDPSPDCFAVRYFDISPALQRLRAKIEIQARSKRQAKLEEWERKKADFEKLMESVEAMECGIFVPRGPDWVGRPRHDRYCKRCAKERTAKAITIEKHEWPLPEEEANIKAVIFELKPPEAIVVWRDATWFLVHDIGRASVPAADVKQILRSYPPLAASARAQNIRVTLASSVKSMQNAHYFKSGLEMDDVLVKNGLRPRMFDTDSKIWTEEQESQSSLTRYCNAQLPKPLKGHLSPYVNMNTHTQNSIIAQHCNCPREMGPHEHVLFGSLRSGERLQWMTILTMLTSAEIDLNSTSTSILLTHAMSQVGTAGVSAPEYLRESQQDLAVGSFCHALLNALESSFAGIEANWKEVTAASVVLAITFKVLSLVPERIDVSRWKDLVQRIRKAGIVWISQLTELHMHQKSESTGGLSLKDLSRQIVNACLLTRQTFNVDEHLLTSLFSDDGAIADYIEAAIHLHDHRQQGAVADDPKQKSDLLNDDYLARRCEKPLLDQLKLRNTAISDGIKRIWHSATFTTAWTIVHQNDTSWLQSKVSSRLVHFNVLTGKLLVSGRPLSHLPTTYTSHPLYRSIFGELDLDVSASDVADMEYLSKPMFEGHRIYFGMRGKTLLLRSSIDGHFFEAILRDTFRGDIPESIVKSSIPWMSLDDGRVLFRPITRPWESHVDDWVLYPAIHSGTTASMRTDHAFLIDHASAVGSTICDIFRPFERRDHIVISRHDQTTTRIKLPRYHLNFFVTLKGEIQCQELSAVLDTSQVIGTLYGLKTRLVLRAVNNVSSVVRSVLIPNGDVVLSIARPHVSAGVHLADAETLSFSHYRVDDKLGRLIADDLEGHLFKSYLHAITSFPENDELTRRTGSEESLLSLSDPITRTSVPFSARSQTLLHLIAQLSPRRKFYPVGMRTMHSDAFHDSLPYLSQRDIFYGTVVDIISHNSKATFLFESQDVQRLSYSGDLPLLDRSYHRTRKLYPCESVSTGQTDPEDKCYFSRDRDESANQAAAASMAGLAGAWLSAFSVRADLRAMVLGWEQINGFGEEYSAFSFSKVLSQDLQQQFAKLLIYCKGHSTSREHLAFLLSLIVFGNPRLARELRTALAFAISPPLMQLPAPEHNTYNLRQGYTVNRGEILTLIAQCEKGFTPAASSDTSDSDSDDEDDDAEREQYERELSDQRQRIIITVEAAWPGDSVRLPGKRSIDHYNFAELKQLLNGRLAAWYKNHVFLSQLDAFDQELETMHHSWSGPTVQSNILPVPGHHVVPGPQTQFSLLDIMCSVPTAEEVLRQSRPSCLDQDLARSICHREHHQHLAANELRCTWEELEDMVEDLTTDSSTIIQEYAKSLNESIIAWKKKTAEEQSRLRIVIQSTLSEKAKDVKDRISQILCRSRRLLQPCESHQALVDAGIWPHVSELTLLQLLTAQHRERVPGDWIKIIILLAREVTALQRVERLQKYMAAKDNFALQCELANPAHAAWEPEQWPDWLLLEIQNNILIRPVQVRVAQELIKPENGLVLLGMGEGKTSVILPMIVTALASGSQLVRVIVLKPLANEMLRLLSSSLAGLVGRTVYHLPFSRQTSLNLETPELLKGIFEDCLQSCGVLLTLPEHLNSFRLVGSDKLGTDKNLSIELIRLQKWLDCNTRDILDESDELLKPAYELVYTNGEANVLSGAPDRWIVALELLALVQRDAVRLQKACPAGIELEMRAPASFPHIRILNEEGARLVTRELAREVVEGKLPGLPLGHCNAKTLKALYHFVHDQEVDSAQFGLVSKHFQGSAQFDLLYVLRGLISQQILAHALRKRWLVNYGLDRGRCYAAVPYRAKSVPSPSAEFAQPETLILLTALSFYYTGIQREDLERCILLLLKSPDPGDDYSKWVADSTLPKKYRSASSLNLDDAYCISELYTNLRYNKAVIDFFLRQVVYPKEAKEFLHKLSSSAWDLCANDGGKVTSGFSGTCDSRIPLTCFQKDIEDLRHGAASTLATLLRYDNRKYICAASASGQRLSTDELLEIIVEHKPQSPAVIIDVGAQFLEDNREIAEKWLRLCSEKMAAIFFSENDEKMVLNRDGSTELFASSIFKDEIGQCMIYLDEFHTRGTDFQLPDHFKAAVLLGPGLLKDSLVQACMRMRKLAVSQSVTFFAPPEVDNSIRALLQDPANIDSSHVIRWCISQSCRTLRSQRPLWAAKGISHSRRRLAFQEHVNTNGKVMNSDQYLDKIREKERRHVSEMYTVNRQNKKELSFQPSEGEKKDPIMSQLLEEWDNTEIKDIKDSGISEEQEREILHEVEEVREVQRPKSARPARPAVSQALWNFISKGQVPEKAGDFRSAFEVFLNTRLASQYKRREWPMEVFVTQDFLRTIVTVAASPQDDFLRPVQWVLLVSCIRQPIIISPHEAQGFLPAIRMHKRATLILYQPRTGRNMLPFDGMNIYRVPASMEPVNVAPDAISLLNLFAGQLYFTTFEDYKRLCALIGLWDGERPLPNQREVASDNFVSPACRAANGWTECKFSTSPVGMLKAFIGMRRLGIEWGHTHMGRMLGGRILRLEDFEDPNDFLAQELGEMTLGEGREVDEESADQESSDGESSEEGSSSGPGMDVARSDGKQSDEQSGEEEPTNEVESAETCRAHETSDDNEGSDEEPTNEVESDETSPDEED
ncbi:hypothetical protein A1O1_02394 [Capronia coronata CBS 617.96]|uniref:ubiquitinyl hydrolase 1 n=1 Tax=Capronia coronata CBS 617.96 TaxID=1182541 RepID=W9YXK6_9EURO|nr:uncharacterized protein A1O1_02394 [Capronia coronata CBS 617.96]EXJ94001.1 hypothetical protein A1O1_02394 [Capronia coronata CBS 617.96]